MLLNPALGIAADVSGNARTVRIEKMKQLIACCGLDCESCDARIATVNNDSKLKEQTAQKWSALNNVEIPPEAINCMGCRVDGVKTVYCSNMCEIRKCVYGKRFNTCRDCNELDDCRIVGAIFQYTPSAKENLLKQEK